MWQSVTHHLMERNINFNDAITQAKSIHAEIVNVYSKYTGTLSGIAPLTLPGTEKQTTNLYGSSGGFLGTAETTSNVTRTTYMPYSIDRYDCFATYWNKQKPPVLGMHTRGLPPELRQKIGSNKGVLVQAVVRDSPAWSADMLNDDIITKIGEREIIDYKTYENAVCDYAGKKVAVEFFRNEKKNTKAITLNPIELCY